MMDLSTKPVPAVGGSQDVFYQRDSLVPLPVMDRALGVRMWDTNGNEYIDASSGPMVSAPSAEEALDNYRWTAQCTYIYCCKWGPPPVGQGAAVCLEQCCGAYANRLERG
jgi:hypothetical protein